MSTQTKIVISASRRTDIPAFYLEWFMAQIKKGYFEVENPFNRRVKVVPATPDEVHTIVFWSKNFGPFIKKSIGRRLEKKGFNLFFNFSINSDAGILEPNVPSLKNRLDQLKHLSSEFGASPINWRFDPICYFKDSGDAVGTNVSDFSHIADKAAQWGISRCITSFMDNYSKIQKRVAAKPGFAFVDPPLDTKVDLILHMEKELTARGIQLFTCCERELVAALPADSTVAHSACIPNDLLLELFGGDISLKKDTGQRVKAGCGCKVSADIGSYRLHPCYHNCLFCYANPTSSCRNNPPELE
jgi:hypothetical protein